MEQKNQLFNLIDELHQLFENSDIDTTFQFEYIKTILCLTLLKLELALTNDISVESRAVFTLLSGWSYHHHKDIRPKIHANFQAINKILRSGKYTLILDDNMIEDHRNKSEWIAFFNAKIANLILESNGMQDSFFYKEK